MVRTGALLALVTAMWLCHGCGREEATPGPTTTARAEPQAEPAAAADPAPGEAAGSRVSGTILGTQVALREAELDDQLAIYEKESWGSSPSLLIFFLGEGDPSDRRIVVRKGDREGGGTTPHVHYRWRNEEGGIESDIAMDDYDMTIHFGPREEGRIPGTLELRIPDAQTSLEGDFVATVE